MLSPLEIYVPFFIYEVMGLDPVKCCFHLFPDILRRCKFQIIRIFQHISVDDSIVEIAELLHMMIVIPIQDPSHFCNGNIGCCRIQLKIQK